MDTVFAMLVVFVISVLPTIIGIAILIGLITFVVKRYKTLEDQYQRQCPNCGGYRVNGKRPTPTSAYLFHCVICGYQWHWKEGTPWPSVRVQPDLISKGYTKLEQEEEEERRKQQEALEGLHHLNQHRK